MSNPFATIVNSVGSLPAGHIVLASEWNAAVGGMYTYVNSTLLPGLNKMNSVGDIYIFDGTNLQVVPTGGAANDGKFLIADSSQALGVRYGSVANVTNLTTKGDLLGFAAANARIPVGTNGQVLTADNTNANGVDWQVAPGVPLGGIILWDLSQRAMPSGYNLCDGGTYNGFLTPNMQGLYLVGAGLSNNPPATSGMGIVASGTIAGQAAAANGSGPNHAHSVTLTAVSVGSGATGVAVGLTPNITTGGAAVTPRYGALAFIMRTQ